MSECLSLLDQALDLGRQEMEHLESGDMSGLKDSSLERGRLIELATSLRGEEGVDLEELMGKLRQLRSMQSTLSSKARSLHETLTEDLARVRREGRRLAGYGKASRITPIFGRRRGKLG